MEAGEVCIVGVWQPVPMLAPGPASKDFVGARRGRSALVAGAGSHSPS